MSVVVAVTVYTNVAYAESATNPAAFAGAFRLGGQTAQQEINGQKTFDSKDILVDAQGELSPRTTGPLVIDGRGAIDIVAGSGKLYTGADTVETTGSGIKLVPR